MERNITNKLEKAAKIAKRLHKFDPKSTEVSNYNEELRMQVSMLGDSKNKKTVEKQIEYVLERMEANKVSPDMTTHSILFDKSLQDNNVDQANVHFRQVAQSMAVERHSEISTQSLGEFFEQSLKVDNFDGLALLADYLEQHSINISNWDMSKFRPALDFYLNHSFDLNRVFTFTRFYMRYVQSSLTGAQCST